jgi:integrase/recombinase XerD
MKRVSSVFSFTLNSKLPLVRVPSCCRCPIWVDGFLGSKEIRKSLNTADWQKAQDFLREWEAKESEPKAPQESMTIQTAGEKFVADAEAQKLAEATIYKYRLLFKQMAAFSLKRGLRYITELNPQMLDEFRAGWKDGPPRSWNASALSFASHKNGIG